MEADAETPTPDLTSLSPEALKAFADRLTPHIVQNLLLTPRYFGDAGRVHVGQHVSLVNTLLNTVSGEVYIGDYVFFGHDVSVLTGTHDVGRFDQERHEGCPTKGRDIVIEQGVWISSNATIIGPCRIGRHAVIGAGSVVIGDVRPGWFYAGTPAKAIKPVSDGFGRVKRRRWWPFGRL